MGFPLDLVTNASIAVGLRKLRSAYAGNCIRVANQAGTELDFGFVSNVVDWAGILTHIGTKKRGKIITWYDQSGNGNNLVKNGSTDVPIIIADAAGKPQVAAMGAPQNNGDNVLRQPGHQLKNDTSFNQPFTHVVSFCPLNYLNETSSWNSVVSGAAGFNYLLLCYPFTNQISSFGGSGGPSISNPYVNSPLERHVVISVIDGANSVTQVDLTASGTVQAGSGVLTTGVRLPGTINGISAGYYEYLLYNRNLNLTDRNLLANDIMGAHPSGEILPPTDIFRSKVIR